MSLLARFLVLIALLGAVMGVGAASAEPMKLRDVMENRSVGKVCGDSARVVATLNFLNAQDASPDKCAVFRYIVASPTQCGCVQEVLKGGGKDPAAYMSSLEMSEYATSCDAGLSDDKLYPAFCAEGCDCKSPISWKAYK